MRYQALFDLLEGKLVQGQLSVGSHEGRKRPESSSPEKLKARNKEKFTAGQAPQAEAEEDYEDEEFDQLLDKDDEEQSQRKAQEPEEEDDYMDEEQMLDIAEHCFERIA